MAKQVALSVFKRVTSRESDLRTCGVVEILATKPNLHQLLHQKGLHLEEPLLVLTEGKIASMQSLLTPNFDPMQLELTIDLLKFQTV